MKRLMKMLTGFLLVLAAIFLLGPRPDNTVEITFDPTTLPDDLDSYLANSEATIPNLVKGAEKEIIWNDTATKSKTPLAIVYVHGFSATKHETRPVPDLVAKALGANLFFTRMTGHGRDGAGLAEAKLQDWTNDFSEAISIGEKLGEKVLVVATSNGATITTWGVAQPQFADRIAGVAFLSPNYALQNLGTELGNIPWAKQLLPMLGGSQTAWEPENELHGKWWTNSYPTKAVFPMMAMLKIVDSIDKATLKTPALFIYSPEDKVVVPQAITRTADEWGGAAKTIPLESVSNPSKHVIAGDIVAAENTQPVAEMIVNWIQSLKL